MANIEYTKEERQFLEDWYNHSLYHTGQHFNVLPMDEAECFINWKAEGKPVVLWKKWGGE